MSYMKDIDEYSEAELQRELDRRRERRTAGNCDYCNRELGSRWRQLDPRKFDPHVRPWPAVTEENSLLGCCKFPERHDMSRPAQEPAPDLSINEFIKTSEQRRAEWHGDDTEPWSGADYAGAMMGEVGEVAEEVVALFLLAKLTEVSGHGADTTKKLRRQETGVKGNKDAQYDKLRKKLGDELADTFAYMCLLADHYDIDIAQAIIDKFNEVSVKHGFPQRLGS